MKLNKFDKIKIIEKYKKMNITHEDLKQRIVKFYDTYNKDIITAKNKLSQAEMLNHEKTIKRISEFIVDVEKSKEMIDDLAKPYTNEQKQTIFTNIKGKLKMVALPMQIYKLDKLMIHGFKMNEKYKKEDCDIDNFEV